MLDTERVAGATPGWCGVVQKAARLDAHGPRRNSFVDRVAPGFAVPGGLGPIKIWSGTSTRGKSRSSNRDNRDVRKCLFEATLSAARFNPSIRAIYRRLKDEGKPHKVGRIAPAPKLLLSRTVEELRSNSQAARA